MENVLKSIKTQLEPEDQLISEANMQIEVKNNPPTVDNIEALLKEHKHITFPNEGVDEKLIEKLVHMRDVEKAVTFTCMQDAVMGFAVIRVNWEGDDG